MCNSLRTRQWLCARSGWGLSLIWGMLAGLESDAARLNRDVNPDKELMITDVSVVNDRRRVHEPCDTQAGDPLYVWDFGNQMANLAALSGASDASVFTEQIFQTLEEVQTINGFTVPSRNDSEQNEGVDAKMLDKWRSDSGGGPLDLALAPFRLDAISFRLDLRQRDRQGRVKNAGEGRFVYGFVQRASQFCHDDNEMRSPQFATFIVECKLPATTDAEVLAWANAVHRLGESEIDYNRALEDLTRQFMAGCMTPDSENSGQLRMNEQTFSDSHSYYHEDTGIIERIEDFWQFREWKMSEGRMVLSTVKQTPDLSLNNSELLASFINDNAALIREQKHNVPLRYDGQAFRGGDARNSTQREEELGEVKYLIPPWNASIKEDDPPQLRELFALNTCNGCHHLETGTAFMHVPTRRYDRPTQLSGFLTGITVPDPVDPSISRSFNDLARRAEDLRALIESGGELPPPLSARPH